MPIFNQNAMNRIRQSVKWTESHGNSNIPPPSRERNGFCELPTTFRNSSGETIPKYALMAISTAAPDGQGCWVLTAVKPSTTFYRLYAVNGPYAVANGDKGQCYTSGHVLVKYDTGTPANGEGWGAKSGQFTASKNYPACLDVFGVWDSTNKIMEAYLHPIKMLIGKLDGDLSQGGSATVSIWAGAAGSEADTGMNVTAYDYFLESGADDIAAGKKVAVRWINGQPYVVVSECP